MASWPAERRSLRGVTATVLGPRFHDALVFASGHFAGRRRGNTHVPAIAHAMAVSALVMDMAAGEDEVIAALLHDVVEDRGGPEALELIRRRWGDAVAGLVEECTDEVEPSGRPWIETKRESVARMATESPAALRIALADKADNAATLVRAFDLEGPSLLDRHSAGSREALLWYYEAVAERFVARSGELGPHAAPLIAQLQSSVKGLRYRSAPAPQPLSSSA